MIVVAHASKIVQDKSYEQLAKRGGFTLNAIDAAKALERKYPALSEETLTTGMLSGAPAIERNSHCCHAAASAWNPAFSSAVSRSVCSQTRMA